MTQPSSRALTERLPRLSPVWLIPLAALLIGLWLVFDHLSGQGPTVTLRLKDAEGIQAGKTAIKTRSVQVGQVESVTLSDDLTHAIVTARLQAGGDRMLNQDSKFWVVKPRIGREGISGLGTVLSGAYIELQPGKSKEEKRKFAVEDQPPVTEAGARGLYLNLDSEPGNSVSTGDPVTYRNLTVGRVVNTEFDAASQHIEHRIFIEKPYDVLVTDTTRFWSVSGVGFELDAQGFRVNLQSLETLLGGGVAFGVPDAGVAPGDPIANDARFTLYADQESARRGLFDQYIEYVMMVEETVRGLRRGAPVEYRGVRVGTVEQVPWHFTADQPDTLTRFAIPVLIRIEPQRVTETTEPLLDDWQQRLDRMFKHGLRATLQSANLLTGALFVDLNFHDDADDYVARRFQNVPVFPTAQGGLAQLEGQITQLMNTLNSLPLEQIANKLDRNLAASETTLRQFGDAAERLEAVLGDPATAQLPARLEQTLNALQQTLGGVAPGSQGYGQLSDTLKRLERLIRDAEPLVRTLRDKPNALIFDRDHDADPLPKAQADE
ncbi:intermembrane transport protein PqiB [Alloalcanivorax mobilis]|uniref:intermembrane transport protein PqiB n=1 Tax=Alloalcanivorax mobilis TaxID=2019569 RepID=UPI000B5B1BBD|nr:intermembrane transport protein PqiB [Alloalcanivorax mobilis]ASK35515.1 mammalian cell entry protein [Alcanivorax sp. N3-2A]|tara:strand:+ start:24843 stop:26489 length:1647 start_codon:yes stop_codon:yes gene_type:complete